MSVVGFFSVSGNGIGRFISVSGVLYAGARFLLQFAETVPSPVVVFCSAILCLVFTSNEDVMYVISVNGTVLFW